MIWKTSVDMTEVTWSLLKHWAAWTMQLYRKVAMYEKKLATIRHSSPIVYMDFFPFPCSYIFYYITVIVIITYN